LHFSRIAESVKVPVCLYHVPGRTCQLLSPEQLAELTSIPGVTAVKEASGDLALFAKARLASKASFLSGDDYAYLPSLAVGGSGVISVVTNVFPEAFVTMSKAFHNQDHGLAMRYHDTLLPFIDCLFCESNPGPLKAALEQMG